VFGGKNKDLFEIEGLFEVEFEIAHRGLGAQRRKISNTKN
jgi:hypothetical protein